MRVIRFLTPFGKCKRGCLLDMLGEVHAVMEHPHDENGFRGDTIEHHMAIDVQFAIALTDLITGGAPMRVVCKARIACSS